MRRSSEPTRQERPVAPRAAGDGVADPRVLLRRCGNGSNGEGRAVLITGGAGFIGSNVAARLLEHGVRVIVLDNLARPGVERNAAYLEQKYGGRLTLVRADIRDTDAVRSAVERASHVFHFAAQVAVTRSLDDPVSDFQVNAMGTVNLLEAIRHSAHRPPLLFTSTNKVYGDLDRLRAACSDSRYAPALEQVRRHGIDECDISFRSPYGCSKGAADQYVSDYAHTFGLRTLVFRMSCIYGPHQCGTEHQGWVAHFVMRALNDQPITIYGDGKQVRDVLFIDDLVDAMLLGMGDIDRLKGRAFNIGGGPGNATSLLELIEILEELRGGSIDLRMGDWRPGDQVFYVSDIRRFEAATRWRPKVGVREGVARLYDWLARGRSRAAGRAVAIGGSAQA